MREQLETADKVAWDSFSDRIDRHFERDNWQTDPVPSQVYPTEVAQVLNILDRDRPLGWLRIDSTIRNFNSEGREKLSLLLRELGKSLKATRIRRFLFGSVEPIQIWLTCDDVQPIPAEIQRHAEIACLAAKVSRVPVLRLQCDVEGAFLSSTCSLFMAPPILRNDYTALAAEADRQRARYLAIDEERKAKNPQ